MTHELKKGDTVFFAGLHTTKGVVIEAAVLVSVGHKQVRTERDVSIAGCVSTFSREDLCLTPEAAVSRLLGLGKLTVEVLEKRLANARSAVALVEAKARELAGAPLATTYVTPTGPLTDVTRAELAAACPKGGRHTLSEVLRLLPPETPLSSRLDGQVITARERLARVHAGDETPTWWLSVGTENYGRTRRLLVCTDMVGFVYSEVLSGA